MAPLGVAYPFGLRDVKISAMSDPVLETYGTSVDLPASRVFSFTESEDFTELRGDDKRITSRGQGAQVSWDMEAGGIQLDVLKLLIGGAVTDSGTTPAQIKKFVKKATDARPFFKVEGQVMSDNGGDVHAVLWRCKATGDVEYAFSDGEWTLTKCSGDAFPSQAAAHVDELYNIMYNETITPIT